MAYRDEIQEVAKIITSWSEEEIEAVHRALEAEHKKAISDIYASEDGDAVCFVIALSMCFSVVYFVEKKDSKFVISETKPLDNSFVVEDEHHDDVFTRKVSERLQIIRAY